MKKAGIALMFVICVLLIAATVHIVVSEDRTAPIIKFSDTRVSYGADDDIAVLLEGVNAIDDRDGDVTNTLVIDGIYLNADGTTAKVVYVARDKQNNIAKSSREIDYLGGDISTIAGVKTAADSENEIDDLNNKESESVTESESESETETEEETEELPEGSPVIKLSTDEVTIQKGETVDTLSYVESITDDKDETNTLWRRISIGGDTLDRYTAGTYELIFYVFDTDGNKSNEAKLTITVK